MFENLMIAVVLVSQEAIHVRFLERWCHCLVWLWLSHDHAVFFVPSSYVIIVPCNLCVSLSLTLEMLTYFCIFHKPWRPKVFFNVKSS